jgi:hypothetical protein
MCFLCHRLSLMCAVLLGLIGSAGCRSIGEPESRSHASVRIAGHGLPEIQRSLIKVFGERGFIPESQTGEQWVLDRPGTTAETLKWGGLEGKRVTIRAKLKSRPVGPGEYLIECDVFSVENKGEKFFEEETRLMMFNRRTYQDLLAEARRRLNEAPAP